MAGGIPRSASGLLPVVRLPSRSVGKGVALVSAPPSSDGEGDLEADGSDDGDKTRCLWRCDERNSIWLVARGRDSRRDRASSIRPLISGRFHLGK